MQLGIGKTNSGAMNSAGCSSHALRHRSTTLFRILAAATQLLLVAGAAAQGFPNIARTEGELLSGPIAPEQGRTAIIAWHGDRIVTVPESPGSQFGADVNMRVVEI